MTDGQCDAAIRDVEQISVDAQKEKMLSNPKLVECITKMTPDQV